MFTFEFLPHFASNVERRADFSLYEAKWNSYGRFGFFEIQVNKPNSVSFPREIELPNFKRVFISDASISNEFGEWSRPRLALYDENKGQVLSSMPHNLILRPEVHLCWKLLFNFNIEERIEIAKLFNFHFPNDEIKEIFFNPIDIPNALLRGDLPLNL